MLQQVKTITLRLLTTIFLIMTLTHGFSYHDKLLSASAEVYDGRIGIVLDEVQRTSTYPSDFSTVRIPAQGHDYCVIHFTINRIDVGHVFVLPGDMDDNTELLDTGGQNYDLAAYIYRGMSFRDIHDITSEAEFVVGTTGILVFEIPIQATPLTLKLAYFYGASWSDYSSPTPSQVDINLTAVEDGYLITSDLWIRAVIRTVEKGPIEAVWEKGGEDTTFRGDRVIWGHFYASPSDVTWGSSNNPDLFVKIWFDVSGRVDVNYFHVSVPDIVVYSDYPYDGTPDEQGTTTMSRRYIRQYYEGGQSNSEENYEDGNPPSGYSPTGNPSGYSTINDLRIGSTINTVEKGPIDAVWRFGGQDTTARGDQVVWGHFYADPSDVTWGSQDNPDLFVKIWFDVSGRVDVNYFHVSVPDIEVYSALPDDSTYDQKGTTIMDNRYIRHEYWR